LEITNDINFTTKEDLAMLKQTVLCKILFVVLCSCAAAGDENGKSEQLFLSATQDDLVARCIRESGHPDNAGRIHDFVEMQYVDETPMPSLHPEEQQRGYLVFRRHWMDLVFPNSIPKRGEITDKLDAFATPGEYESVTFCVRTLRKLNGLEVKTGWLVSEEGDRLAAPEVRIVRCTPRLMQGGSPVHQGGTSGFGTFGLMDMPTYLEKARTVDIEAGTTVQYWLTLQVDADAPAGVYQGDIEITQEGENAHRLSLTVKIFPITLLEPTVTLGFWDLQRAYDGEIGTIADVYETMSHHGVNAVFTSAGLWQWDPETNTYDFSRHLAVAEDGRVRITFEGSPLEKHMEAAKRAGFKAVCFVPRFDGVVREAVRKLVDNQTLDQEISGELATVLGRYKGSEYYDLIKGETTSASKSGSHYPLFSEAYARVYVQILREIIKEGRSRGWPEIIVSPGDERYSHHRDGDRTCLPLAIRRLELMKQAEAKTTVNGLTPFLPGEYGVYAREALRFVDIMMGGPSRVQQKVVQGFANMGVTTYIYNLNIYHGQMTPDLGAARFGAGYYFETFGDGVEGELEYVYFRPEGNPYDPLDEMYYWHEFMWFFPPREAEGRLGGPAICLAARREGVDDLRYLQTLDALIKQAQAKTACPDAQQAARDGMAMRNRIVGSFEFTTMTEEGTKTASLDAQAHDLSYDQMLNTLIEQRQWPPRSSWDTLVASPGVEPVVKGSYRLHNGWDFETYDRNRRDIAGSIIKIQEALAE
jgi:hypothetical protein